MNRRAATIRMTATVLAGMVYGFAVISGLMPSHEVWTQSAPTVVPPYVMGGGLLGVIYARQIEHALRDPEACREQVFVHDLCFSMLGTLLLTSLLGTGDWPALVIFIPPLILLTGIRLHAIVKPSARSCEQAPPSVRLS